MKHSSVPTVLIVTIAPPVQIFLLFGAWLFDTNNNMALEWGDWLLCLVVPFWAWGCILFW